MPRGVQFSIPPQDVLVPDLYNVVFIQGDIVEETALEVSQKILSIEFLNKSNDRSEPITLFINSGGGLVSAAWQICDLMDFVDTPVHTVGLGTVASAALMILMNGAAGERKVTDRTTLMSHRFSAGAVGNHSNLIAVNKEFESMHDRIIKHYEECTGLDKKEIESQLLQEHDAWLNPKEAKKFNIIDEIVTSNKTKRLKEANKKTGSSNGRRKKI